MYSPPESLRFSSRTNRRRAALSTLVRSAFCLAPRCFNSAIPISLFHRQMTCHRWDSLPKRTFQAHTPSSQKHSDNQPRSQSKYCVSDCRPTPLTTLGRRILATLRIKLLPALVCWNGADQSGPRHEAGVGEISTAQLPSQRNWDLRTTTVGESYALVEKLRKLFRKIARMPLDDDTRRIRTTSIQRRQARQTIYSFEARAVKEFLHGGLRFVSVLQAERHVPHLQNFM